jgi:apolipoprotein D and lipocalin family protein
MKTSLVFSLLLWMSCAHSHISLDGDKFFRSRSNLLTTLEHTGEHGILISALEKTKLDVVISESDELTLLAPNDQAFKALPAGQLEEWLQDPNRLQEILLYHVAEGALRLRDIQKQNGLRTLSGLFVPYNQDLQLLEEITIKRSIKSSQGLIHVVDGVLIPSNSSAQNELTTVPFVEVERYMGRWYEIARFPQSFQRKCGATIAEYKLRSDGRVDVTNSCQRIDRPGKIQDAKAIARVVDTESNSKLSVSFVPLLRQFGFFGGDYWILELGDNYEYAVVGSPNRNTLWFLSRTPSMNPALYAELLERVRLQGFDVDRLVRSPTWP